MTVRQLRATLIMTLVAAAIVSVIGQKRDSPFIGWIAFTLFLVGVALYFQWRRAVANARDKVFDREAETSDETGTRPDQ